MGPRAALLKDHTVQNLTVTNSAIRESPCGENTAFWDTTRVSTSQSIC